MVNGMVCSKIKHLVATFSCRCDAPLTITSDASAMSGLVGYTAEEIQRDYHNSLMELIHMQDRDKVRKALDSQLACQDDIELGFFITRKDGKDIWVLGRGCCVTQNEEKILYGIMVEITDAKFAYDEEKRVEKELKEQAQRDSLTNLLNTYTTRKRIGEYLSSQDVGCAMLIIDLDEFKKVNDKYGHLQGDAVLVQTAEVISKLFRAKDIVGRVGGDEFLVLMRDVSDESLVNKRCEQLISEVHQVLRAELKEWELSCSIGVAFSTGKGKSYSELFKCADQALYQAKEQGKNQFVIYNK